MPDNNLPEGYKVVDLHKLPKEQQQELMTQVFELLHKNYGSFAQSESQEKWENRLYEAGKEGTTLMVSTVVGPSGNVAAFSAAERYDEKIGKGATLITYTCADAETQGANYQAFLNASKDGILNSIVDLKNSGVAINGVFQEHVVGKPTHAPKIAAGFEEGQIPLSSPSSSAPFNDYIIPVFKADVKGADIEGAIAGATKANLFIADISPSNPNMSFAEIIKGLRDGYVDNNSFFRHDPSLGVVGIGFQPEQDPGYQSLTRYADSLDPTKTYDQIYTEAKKNAAQYLGLAEPQRNYVELQQRTYDSTAGYTR